MQRTAAARRLCGFVGCAVRPSSSSSFSSALLRGTLVATSTSSSSLRFVRAASSLNGAEWVREPLEDILRKAQYREIANALEGEGRVRLTLPEYLDLCKKHNVEENEGRELLKALHKSGRVLHYENTPELAATVIVRPAALASSFVKLLDVQGEYSRSFVQTKQDELAALHQELQQLDVSRKQLEEQAYKRADNWIRLGLAYIVLQAGVVARLTWWELSWDIMEPVTYVLTFGTAIGAMAYFTHTKTEYTYEGLREHLAQTRLQKLYKKNNFDINHYKELERKVTQTEIELAAPEVHLLKFNTLALQ